MFNVMKGLAECSSAYIAGVDLKRVRLAIVRERERQGLTQQQVASRADMRQGHLSNVENVDGLEMKDLAARVLFQIIESGLGKPLSTFFREIERQESGADLAGEIAPTRAPVVEGRPLGDSVPAQGLTPADLDRLGRTIGRSIARELRPARPRERSAKTRAHSTKRRTRSE